MTTALEQTIVRALPEPDRRSWLRWGVAVFLGLETVHFIGGLLGNDWEGWSTFFVNFTFVAVTGLVLVGLTYGLLVRWALQDSPRGRNRPALGALAAGLVSIAAYAIFYTWAPILIAPGAILLGRAGLARAQAGQRGRHPAIVGAALGMLSVAVFVTLISYAALHHGEYPWIFGG